MPRVLIVDDKEENRYYLQALLTGHGFAVDAARHGAEALILARQRAPDLVVSDLLMPVMDGFTLLRHWKADAKFRAIPFVVYTATYTEAADERLALGLGADAFILKPAEPDEFLARLGEVRARAEAAQPTAARPAPEDEPALLKVYSEALIRKLEEKTLQLEETNRALQRDIAERKRAEENLRESEERFRATFEQTAVGISHVSPEGRFLRVNDRLCGITGYPREELAELTFDDLTEPEDRAAGQEARRELLAGERTMCSFEKRYRRKDGATIWVNVYTTLLRDRAGQPKYFIAVTTDVTERKVLQEQFRQSQKMEAFGQLAGGVAHDFNNILSVVMMQAQLSSMAEELPPEVLRGLQVIRACAERGANLTRQLLLFSHKQVMQPRDLDLNQAVTSLARMLQRLIEEHVRLQLHLHPAPLMTHADPGMIDQVLMNLAVNARDAMPQGGRLLIETSEVTVDGAADPGGAQAAPGTYVCLSVSDTGSGIAPEVLPRIFEPFFTTKAPGKGTGLGLATVFSIVQQHRGRVDVASEPGRGTTFRVLLPAVKPTAQAAEAGDLELPRGGAETVLVVEDEPAVRLLTRVVLERAGYRVLEAADGNEARALWRRHGGEIRLLLTDIVMPGGVSGHELAEQLQAEDARLKVIFTSGYSADVSGRVRTLTDGENFIQKPATPQQILKTVRRCLDA